MSADNGVYIAKFPDGYRVVHAQNIENIDYFPVGSAKRKRELKAFFGKSKVYVTEDEAFEKAKEIAKEIESDDFCPILEYGICLLPGEFELWD